MSHSSEGHGTHDLTAPMSDPSMTGDLVERLRELVIDEDHDWKATTEAASLITKQADEIERLTRERDAYAQSVKDLGGIVRHNVSRAEAAEARIAVLEAALVPFAALLDRIPMAADHVEIAAINGDLVEAFVDECLSLTIGDFRAARNALVTP